MDIDSALLWALIVGILIEGVWLSGLIYLMWKGHQDREDQAIKA